MASKGKGNNRETVAMEPQRGSRGAAKKSSGNNARKSSSKSAPSKKSASSKSASKKPSSSGREKRGLPNELVAIIMLAIGVFLLLSFHTDVAGALGGYIDTFFKGILGFGAYFIPYLMIVYSVLMLIRKTPKWRWTTSIWMVLLILGIDLINSCRYIGQMGGAFKGFKDVYFAGAKCANGGLFGMYAGGGLYKVGGLALLYIVAVVLILTGLIMLFRRTYQMFAGTYQERKEARIERGEKVPKEKKRERQPLVDDMPGPAPSRPAPANAQRQDGEQVRMDDFYAKYEDEKKKESFLRNIGFKNEEAKTPGTSPPPKWPRKMPKNQKDILNLVWNEKEFGESAQKEGYGLDGSQESLYQEPDFNEVNARRKEGWATSEFEDFINGKDEAPKNDKPLNDKSKNEEFVGFKDSNISDTPKSTFTTGGASVATTKSATEDESSDVDVTPTRRGRYKLPPLELLKAPSVDTMKSKPSENLNEKAALLEKTLESFGVDAKVVNVISGPSVTRYEIQPAIGVKVQKITSLSDDIALNMRASSIRIEAPIPGKAAVGIEIENSERQAVTLREIIGSAAFRSNRSKLAFSVGRDIGGNAVVADLAKMPHLLIAGATGSGKSVCINTLIASILYKARPEEVKMILIDPKMVELGNYNGIPHLLIPVVTDASKAASALNWAVAEMTDRYKKFAANNVKDIGSYNQYMKEKGEKEEILPQIVVIIDELSDLMMVASSQVEDAICRLAQLARAAGMHLVVATQRPSVDVVTGLIKANIPSRIAFNVSSQIDSRTIIDMPGAEKLVGNGDMLFKPQDLNKPKRIQGPFVSSGEIQDLIEYVKSQSGEAQYDEEVIQQIDKGKDFSGSDEGDELLMDAIGVVVNAGQASVSMLQRRFRIGYNRAARIVDIMEERGIVGPPDGARPRQVLITEAEYDNMKEAGEI